MKCTMMPLLLSLLIGHVNFCMIGDQMPVLILPVNNLQNSKTHVDIAVAIPDNFKVLNQKPTPQLILYEFVPRADGDSQKWSELITAHVFIGNKSAASQIVKSLRDKIVVNHNGRVFEASGEQHDSYCLRRLALVYTMQGRRELLFAQYASGTHDCSGVQYAIALNAQMDEAKALAKAEEFMKNKVQILVRNNDPSHAVD